MLHSQERSYHRGKSIEAISTPLPQNIHKPLVLKIRESNDCPWFLTKNLSNITHAIETSTTTIHFVLKVNIRAGTTVEVWKNFFSLIQYIQPSYGYDGGAEFP